MVELSDIGNTQVSLLMVGGITLVAWWFGLINFDIGALSPQIGEESDY